MLSTGNFFVSASRDGTVKIWSVELELIHTINHNGFINSLTYIDPSSIHTEGRIVLSGKDKIIHIHSLENFEETDTLYGHSENVSALHYSDGTLASGSWDQSIRVWKKDASTDVIVPDSHLVLTGHAGSIWDVKVISQREILSASADATIFLWDNSAIKRKFLGHTQPVRSLALIPDSSTFLSGSNDGAVKLWNIKTGECIFSIDDAHPSFIFSLSAISLSSYATSGEECQLRVWSKEHKTQVIEHPALSVWTVFMCKETGDILTGASDGFLRLFTQCKDRWDEELYENYTSRVNRQISLSNSNMTDIDRESLPGMEVLNTQGKDGEVKMLKNGVSIEAYQFNDGQWVKIGDVLGSNSQKTKYNGKEYDFVFDVDIQDGAPPLKLPYNKDQVPLDAAREFINSNNLPLAYQEQVADFIIKNSGWKPNSDLRPHEGDEPSSKTSLLPQREYVCLNDNTNISKIRGKLMDATGPYGFLDAASSKVLENTLNKLSGSYPYPALLKPELDVLCMIALEWDPSIAFAGLDLLRLAISSTVVVGYKYNGLSFFNELLISCGMRHPNSLLMVIRCYINSFSQTINREGLAEDIPSLEQIIKWCDQMQSASTSKAINGAWSIFLLNCSVYFATCSGKGNNAYLVLPYLLNSLKSEDSTIVLRTIVGIGTLLSIPDVAANAKAERLGIDLQEASVKWTDDSRINSYIEEIYHIMG